METVAVPHGQANMECMSPTISKTGRLVLQLILFSVFLWVFGLPAIAKYQERSVGEVKSQRDTGGIPAPAVTIFAGTANPYNPWKNSSSTMIEDACGGLAKN